MTAIATSNDGVAGRELALGETMAVLKRLLDEYHSVQGKMTQLRRNDCLNGYLEFIHVYAKGVDDSNKINTSHGVIIRMPAERQRERENNIMQQTLSTSVSTSSIQLSGYKHGERINLDISETQVISTTASTALSRGRPARGTQARAYDDANERMPCQPKPPARAAEEPTSRQRQPAPRGEPGGRLRRLFL